MSETVDNNKSQVLIKILQNGTVDIDFPQDPLVKELYNKNLDRRETYGAIKSLFSNLFCFGIICGVNYLLFGKETVLNSLGEIILVFFSATITFTLLLDYLGYKKYQLLILQFDEKYKTKELQNDKKEDEK